MHITHKIAFMIQIPFENLQASTAKIYYTKDAGIYHQLDPGDHIEDTSHIRSRKPEPHHKNQSQSRHKKKI